MSDYRERSIHYFVDTPPAIHPCPAMQAPAKRMRLTTVDFGKVNCQLCIAWLQRRGIAVRSLPPVVCHLETPMGRLCAPKPEGYQVLSPRLSHVNCESCRYLLKLSANADRATKARSFDSLPSGFAFVELWPRRGSVVSHRVEAATCLDTASVLFTEACAERQEAPVLIVAFRRHPDRISLPSAWTLDAAAPPLNPLPATRPMFDQVAPTLRPM